MKPRTLTLSTVLLLVAALATAAHAQFSVVYNFGSHSGDPQNPDFSGIIAQGRDGNLYSTAPQGGGCSNGGGAVFKITPAGALGVINCSGGTSFSQSGLMLGSDGNFYGTAPFNTLSGAGGGNGTIFKVTPSGSLTALHAFTGGADGKFPTAPPVQGIDGNFYGTTSQGNGNTVFGSVYKITPSLAFSVLHSFIDSTDGAFPQAPLLQGTDGNFYGTTEAGDRNNGGTIFKITPFGMFTPLFDFAQSSPLGSNPFVPLIQGSDGNFYGTTAHGGSDNQGIVFKITPGGTLSVLHNFTGTGDGTQPVGGLVQATDGNLYGTTSMATGTSGCGTIFRISPNGANFTTLHTFPADGSAGCRPHVTLVQHTNGVLYGDTHAGGKGGVTLPSGVFFSLNASLPPFVHMLPYSGKVGKTIEFLGQGFTSTSTVSFSGTAATGTVVSGTYLTATVPNGATTGFVTVTTSGGALKSNQIFRVIPQITGFSPSSGPVGTSVTVTGASLKQTKKVTFGGVAATFTVNSDSKVTAIVPSGAVIGKIAITTLGGTAVSSGTFTVTLPSPLAINSGAPPSGTVGKLYFFHCTQIPLCNIFTAGFPLTATGGVQPYSWSWVGAQGSTTPPGLGLRSVAFFGDGCLNVSLPAICGTPTTAGSYNVIVTVRDSESPAMQESANYTIVISP
jgi:uncharacterized repeat protein (TIGR03803 family)